MTTSKIFGIGLSRTGTTTLDSILCQYSYKCIHFIPELLKKEPQWDVIERYDVLSDSPIPMLYKECDRRYPNSKFILTTRNIDSWLSSMKWMFTEGKSVFNWGRLEPRYHKKFYGTKTYNKKILEVHWRNYHNDVSNYFLNRPNDLLVINIEEGFNLNQLCDFLEIPYREVAIQKLNIRRKSTVYQKIKHFVTRELIS